MWRERSTSCSDIRGSKIAEVSTLVSARRMNLNLRRYHLTPVDVCGLKVAFAADGRKYPTVGGTGNVMRDLGRDTNYVCTRVPRNNFDEEERCGVFRR